MNEESVEFEEGVKEDLAGALWDVEGGGKDFHASKWNHAFAEGYELTYWEPFYPQFIIWESKYEGEQ